MPPAIGQMIRPLKFIRVTLIASEIKTAILRHVQEKNNSYAPRLFKCKK
ncbi:Uncharacterised protein [Sphingobacterium thalpophilum]|uniref:Uncharacterized protein n=1 Tax=Sphingobacterium thalpophilum TaxID=259 RepID=A0A4U9W057_9SPHI|nr:Uncharacterised protein [Sphingobacterium thalpophilum]